MKFFIKRVCILYFVLICVCFLTKGQKIPMIVALSLGTFFSLLRFGLLETMINYMCRSGNKTLTIVASLMIYVFGLLVIGITTVFALNFGVYTFIAALAGSLSIVIVTVINAVTEALGITKNRFGEVI
ncbi:hypothetical protein LY28_00753 [Ruminiclostridium sufflavum DSM 19573]|uniref:Uncharacterized protein n=1 Tax=Ruminiclostridium sufflavum DSM 19573 TaxID=1121337 RepID=A0A318XSH9_9FIRM|nr:hypothetical protein LY28_00753 [Ruminiclostridium sufflavum DSM 19573]